MGTCLSVPQGSKVDSASPGSSEIPNQDLTPQLEKVVNGGQPQDSSASRTSKGALWSLVSRLGRKTDVPAATADAGMENGPKSAVPESNAIAAVQFATTEAIPEAIALPKAAPGSDDVDHAPAVSAVADADTRKDKEPGESKLDQLAREQRAKAQPVEVPSKRGSEEEDVMEEWEVQEEEAGRREREGEGVEDELPENVSLFGTGTSMRKPPEAGPGSLRPSSKRVKVERIPGSVLERHNVAILGEGPQLLFLSHGFGTNQHIWAPLLDDLDLLTTYRVILWDLMGAYSTDPEGFNFQRYSTLHGYADDLLEVLDELEVEEMTYIGHSVSGMIGLIASIERPQIFKRMILIGASPRYLDQPGYRGGFTVEMLDQVFAAMQDNYKAWASGFAPMVVGEDVDSPGVREFCRSLFLVRPDIAFSSLKTIFTADMRHLLPQCKIQVHLLQTSRDAAVPWEPVQYMLDHFPNACVEMLPVAGHLPHLTHPKIVAEAVLRHLEMPIRPPPSSHESGSQLESGRSTVSTESDRFHRGGVHSESFGEY